MDLMIDDELVEVVDALHVRANSTKIPSPRKNPAERHTDPDRRN